MYIYISICIDAYIYIYKYIYIYIYSNMYVYFYIYSIFPCYRCGPCERAGDGLGVASRILDGRGETDHRDDRLQRGPAQDRPQQGHEVAEGHRPRPPGRVSTLHAARYYTLKTSKIV